MLSLAPAIGEIGGQTRLTCGGLAARSALLVSKIMTDYNAERGLVQVVGVHGQDEAGRV